MINMLITSYDLTVSQYYMNSFIMCSALGCSWMFECATSNNTRMYTEECATISNTYAIKIHIYIALFFEITHSLVCIPDNVLQAITRMYTVPSISWRCRRVSKKSWNTFDECRNEQCTYDGMDGAATNMKRMNSNFGLRSVWLNVERTR